MKALLIKPETNPKIINIDSSLESLQKAVGGYIEAIYPYSDNVAVLLDEEGRFKGKHPNRTIIADSGVSYGTVVGDFLIVGINGEDFTSLSDELLEKYSDRFSL